MSNRINYSSAWRTLPSLIFVYCIIWRDRRDNTIEYHYHYMFLLWDPYPVSNLHQQVMGPEASGPTALAIKLNGLEASVNFNLLSIHICDTHSDCREYFNSGEHTALTMFYPSPTCFSRSYKTFFFEDGFCMANSVFAVDLLKIILRFCGRLGWL